MTEEFCTFLDTINEMVCDGYSWADIDAAIGCSKHYSLRLYKDGKNSGYIEDVAIARLRRTIDKRKALFV